MLYAATIHILVTANSPGEAADAIAEGLRPVVKDWGYIRRPDGSHAHAVEVDAAPVNDNYKEGGFLQRQDQLLGQLFDAPSSGVDIKPVTVQFFADAVKSLCRQHGDRNCDENIELLRFRLSQAETTYVGMPKP